ncbi:MAG: hypothetical protein JRE47_11035 [Deltaproteobacteria bacterium]|nr:hypothetical protein [Deltaproteobacteria bacterium]
MKKLLFAICLTIITPIIFNISGAEATEYDNMKIEFLDEDFTLNMPSSEVTKKLINIRKKYGAKLYFMGGVTIIYERGGIGLDLTHYGNIIIEKGSLIKFKKTFTTSSEFRAYDVEDELKDELVKYSVKFGTPLYKKISKRSGSIVWLHKGARFEIEKEASGNSSRETIIIELADEKKIKKASVKDFEDLEKKLKDKDENLLKASEYRNQSYNAADKQDYILSLEACNNSIFYYPEDERSFLLRSHVHYFLKKYHEAGLDAKIAFYKLYKNELKDPRKPVGEMLAEAIELEAYSLFKRPNRRFEILILKERADYVISKYNPQSGQLYVVRAFCLQLEKDWGAKDITEDMICSDLKKACELGVCNRFKSFGYE